MVVLENVRGMISTGALHVVLRAFMDRGLTTTWTMLNAAHFGVASERDRVFVVGFRDPEDAARFRWPVETHAVRGSMFGAVPVVTARDAIGVAYDRPAPTVTATEFRSALHFGSQGAKTAPRRCGDTLNPLLGRRITTDECAALMGFPRDYRWHATGTPAGQRNSIYRQIGNAVPPLLGEAVGRSIASALYS